METKLERIEEIVKKYASCLHKLSQNARSRIQECKLGFDEKMKYSCKLYYTVV